MIEAKNSALSASHAELSRTSTMDRADGDNLPVIMVVDDDIINRRLIERWVQPKAKHVIVCESAEAALEKLAQESVDILISDIQMRGMSGLDLSAKLKDAQSPIAIILITAYGDQAALLAALNLGIEHFLIKPIVQNALLGYVDKLCEALSNRKRLHLARQEIIAKNQLLENARRKEQETGAAIQRMVLYRTPDTYVAGVECRYELHPAQIVNGDYLDHFVHNDTVFDVAIGDAMGKGLSAALLAAGVKTGLMRAISDKSVQRAHEVPDLQDVFRIVQKETYYALSQLDSFVTLLYARIDAHARLLSWIDCGHGKVILQRKHLQQAILLSGDNMPLGLSSNEKYQIRTCPLFEGDRLYLVTDGLTEVQVSEGENLDFSGLARIVNSHKSMSLEQSVADVMHTVEQLEPQNTVGADDKTLLAMEFHSLDHGKKCPGFHYQSFDAAMSSLPVARDWIREILVREAQSPNSALAALSDQERESWIQSFILGASECYSNVVRHGLNQNSKVVELTLAGVGDHMYMEIVYNGVYFSPTEKSKKLKEEPSENGYGLFLMNSIFDEMLYHPDRSGSQMVAVYKQIV